MPKRIFLLILFVSALYSTQIYANDILKAAKEELTRAYTELKSQSTPPYFISYGITETKELRLSSSFGKIDRIDSVKSRILDIDLRVGTPKFDNTHIIRGQRFSFGFSRSSFALPIENDVQALKSEIWLSTDKMYKSAVETYEKAITNKAVKIAEEDSSADFSMDKSEVYSDKDFDINIDIERWTGILNRVSAQFNNDDKIYFGKVNMVLEQNKKYFISTEGTEIFQVEPFIRIYISGQTKADDGMSLPLYESFFAFTPEQLPTEEMLIKEVLKLMQTLKELREAPLMTTYSGPALLSGEASGVFFHEIFGHRVEGHRQKDPDDAQTFKNSIGEKVISEIISVIFDPTIKEKNKHYLSGYYKYDDEGVKAQKVKVVENGIFKNFLMSRSPIDGFNNSNGHGRREAGNKAVSRQSNLIIESSNIKSIPELRKMLIEEAKKQDKEFGLFFVKVQGGFTFTGRAIPNSFNVNPLLVYKIYVDGRPDEMVRGVDLIGTPLTTFANITATGDDFEVFNGICGAESGGVPVSAASATLLVNKIEVQKKKKSQAKLPILPAPIQGNNP